MEKVVNTTYEDLFLGFAEDERDLFFNSNATTFFKYIYESDYFQNILKKINSSDCLSDDEWKYVLERLFYISVKSESEYEVDKLDFKDRIIQLFCRVGMFFTSEDSGLYNEFYKMREFLDSFRKLRSISNDLYNAYELVDSERDVKLLKLLIEHNLVCCDFRDFRQKFMDVYDYHNHHSLDETGLVAGDERSNINLMNRAYDKAKKLVLKYQECYNTNIDCEEE